jgi:hypothetical protein
MEEKTPERTSTDGAQKMKGIKANSILHLDVAAPPWGYNPSAWGQRASICLLASIGFLIAADMGFYEWRRISDV